MLFATDSKTILLEPLLCKIERSNNWSIKLNEALHAIQELWSERWLLANRFNMLECTRENATNQ